jgi:outer membrane lipoprotein-sorting protein
MLLRRTLLLALPALLAIPPEGRAQAAFAPTARDAADLARIEAYLNGLKTMKARFLQVAPDGGITNGSAWLSRPGRLRFEYDPPAPFLLVAGQTGLIFHDSSLRQTSNIPISRTPLGILLAEQAKLSGDVTVTGIERLPNQIHVSLVRTASPGDGSLTLTFADAPLALRQWRVVDAQRKETRVTLFNMELGGRFDPKLFEFREDDPMPGATGGG